jgi:hypothetical protein
MGCIVPEFESQQSSEMLMDSPEPNLFINQNFKTSLPAKTALHVLEAALGAEADIIS